MKARKMWAPKGWERADASSFFSYRDAGREWEEVEVAKVDHSRPDFEPGDRVRSMAGGDAEVLTYPQHAGSRDWWPMVVRVHATSDVEVWDASAVGLTKLPRETSVLLRVTGPEDGVEAFARTARTAPAGVRVERVEEER